MRVKKILIILMFLNLLPNISLAQNTICVGEYPAAVNGPVTVSVGLENADAITGVQMEISLGENLTYVASSATLASRTEGVGWNIIANLKGTGADSKLKVLVYNTNLTNFTGYSGTIFTFQLTCGATASENPLAVSGLICTSATGESVDAMATSGKVIINAIKYATAEYGEITGPSFAQPGENVTVTVAPASNYKLESLYYTENGSSTPNPINLETLTFTMPSAWVTVTATFVPKGNITVKFHNNGIETQQSVEDGQPVTLPKVNTPAEFQFIGWKTEEIDYSTSVPTVDVEAGETEYTPTADCDLYTVFGRKKTCYVLDESAKIDDCAGKKVIIEITDKASGIYYGIDMTGSKLATRVLTTITTASNTVAKDEDLAVTITQHTISSNTGYAISNNAKPPLHLKKNSYTAQLSSDPISATSDIFVNYMSVHYLKCVAGNYLNLYSGGFTIESKNSTYRLYVENTVVYDYFSIQPTLISGTLETHSYSGRCIVVGETTIPADAAVKFTGILQDATPENFTVKDGGQLIVSNSVSVNVEKKINAASTWNEVGEAGNWYGIGIPNTVATPGDVEGLITVGVSNDYDLYQYDEPSYTWQNYKAHPDLTLEAGRGYLYASQAGTTINFKGEVNVGDIHVSLTSQYANTGMRGLNFIANPYTHNIYKGKGAAIDNSNLAVGSYTLTNDGEWRANLDDSAPIKVGTAVLVKTTTDCDFNITNKTSSGSKSNNDFIAIKVANSQYEDVTYALFDEGFGLPKISHRNSEIPMVFIISDGEDYAIATMDDDVTSFNLGLESSSASKMTLTIKTRGNFQYIHLIDRMTGEDIDMLFEDGYNFVSSPLDMKSRFIVNLKYKADINDEGEGIDIYQHGEELYVAGDGTFQLIDMLGRIVLSESISGHTKVNVSDIVKGAYIVRLIGSDTKTEKIIVR